MKRTVVVLALVVGLLLAPAAGAARWRIDAGGGGFAPLAAGEFRASGVDFDVDVDAGGSFALGGGWGLGDWVDLGGRFQGSFAGLHVLGASLDVFSVTAGPRVYLAPRAWPFRPWLTTEIGWYRAQAEFDALFFRVSERDDSFGLNAGGGFDVAVHRRISLGVDVRYHNAFDALGGIDFVTALLNVGIHFGG
jgi:hypothetical protein